MAITNTIEELAFELAENYTSGDVEKLIKLLDLLLNGKKTVEARDGKVDVAPPAKAAAPKAKSAKASESNDSEDEPF